MPRRGTLALLVLALKDGAVQALPFLDNEEKEQGLGSDAAMGALAKGRVLSKLEFMRELQWNEALQDRAFDALDEDVDGLLDREPFLRLERRAEALEGVTALAELKAKPNKMLVYNAKKGGSDVYNVIVKIVPSGDNDHSENELVIMQKLHDVLVAPTNDYIVKLHPDASDISVTKADLEGEMKAAGLPEDFDLKTNFPRHTGADPKFAAIVMDKLEGKPLNQWTPADTAAKEKCKTTLQAAVAAIHEANVAHLDLKVGSGTDDNVMVKPDGTAQLFDFGQSVWAATDETPLVAGASTGTAAVATSDDTGDPTEDCNSVVCGRQMFVNFMLKGRQPPLSKAKAADKKSLATLLAALDKL